MSWIEITFLLKDKDIDKSQVNDVPEISFPASKSMKIRNRRELSKIFIHRGSFLPKQQCWGGKSEEWGPTAITHCASHCYSVCKILVLWTLVNVLFSWTATQHKWVEWIVFITHRHLIWGLLIWCDSITKES